MARRKNYKHMASWIAMLLGWIALIGIGGLFINGTFLNVVLLKFLPQIVHTIV
jgi:hypothetical protein